MRPTDTSRRTTTQRGYGIRHRKLRAEWVPIVLTGTIRCWRCHRFIAPDEPWDLGHDDRDRTRYRGPEHIRCNRATAGRRNMPERVECWIE